MDGQTELKVMILDGAYRRLEAGKSRTYSGICSAIECEIDSIYGVGGIGIYRRELLSYIEKSLRGWFIYPAYLTQEACFDIKSIEDFKRGRLAWIDAMIAALRAGEPLPDRPSLPSDFVPRAADGAIVTRKFQL